MISLIERTRTIPRIGRAAIEGLDRAVDLRAGRYRIQHFGDHKGREGKISEFTGTSAEFEI
ncbi:hypothetical protein FCG67_16485 [Rhodococcus oryzae]|uniref:Neutral/alkaline non-lysosomal ceramidase C-terminal domain-containing protein n=1 Tax=Rhodococcus oryzae TaxID=2571143 RepID=A0ABY2RL30_9NOCA|nr:hypothetical protein FCG67_16485 [Rhodococcus oryzae]